MNVVVGTFSICIRYGLITLTYLHLFSARLKIKYIWYKYKWIQIWFLKFGEADILHHNQITIKTNEEKGGGLSFKKPQPT